MTEGERIIALEQQMQFTRSDIAEIKADLKSILNQLSSMSGGRKALLGLFGLLGTLLGAAISALLSSLHR